jgi:hypothetical protein
LSFASESSAAGTRNIAPPRYNQKIPPLPERIPAMSIGFEPPEIQLRKLREKLQAMSDQELIDFGRIPKRLAAFPTHSIDWQRREQSGDAGIREKHGGASAHLFCKILIS